MNLIANRLKDIAKKYKSEREFARHLGVANTTVNQYLNGRSPTIDFCVLVCERTNTDLLWLITGKEQDKTITIPINNPLLNKINTLTDTEIIKVSAYIDGLIANRPADTDKIKEA